jgi:signal transduction histidine kinase
MIFYTQLSKIGFLKNSYARKFLFVAFLGIHLPLTGLIFFLVFFENEISPISIFSITFLLTLFATFVTLYVLKKLINPIEMVSKAIVNYKSNRIIPSIELESDDEVGQLISDINETMKINENLLTQKQDLIYLFSHDLKNFADNSHAIAQLIIKENPSETASSYAKLIVQSSEKQNDFLKTFITLMKEEEVLSKKTNKIKTVDLHQIANEVQAELQQKLLNKNINLNMDIQTSDVALKIEKDLLTQVLINLVDNAIKFSYSGSSITIEIKREHSHLVIAVKDNGIGFENAKSELLFKKFTSMVRLGTANEKSTGIGLYLCNQIVKKSGGSFYAESSGEDKGAIFYVNLKIYKRL